MTKWPDRPRSEFVGHYLGADEHGDWVGARLGTACRRGDASYDAHADWVTLLPRAAWWRAGFYDPPVSTATYVDIATPPVWEGACVTCVDLDLDVVVQADGELVVADEDEFDEHRVSLSYPDEVVTSAEASLAWVRAAVLAGTPPFDGSHEPWLAALRAQGPA